jgi:TRAP-type C4-dicarboxylate transport system permease small subunit
MPDYQQRASRVLARLNQFEKLLTIAAFIVLVSVVFADVVSREVQGAGLFWASQTGVWANVIVVMAGFGLASSAGAHLRPRFADQWLPVSWHATIETLQHLVMALFCLSLGLLASRVVAGSWQLGELSLDLFLPVWPIQLFLPLAFLAGTLRHGLYAFDPSLRPAESTSAAFVAGDDQQ